MVRRMKRKISKAKIAKARSAKRSGPARTAASRKTNVKRATPKKNAAKAKSAKTSARVRKTAAEIDPLAAYVEVAASALGLKIAPEWMPNILFNLRLVLRHAGLVDEFPLSDEAEPAPVFRA